MFIVLFVTSLLLMLKKYKSIVLYKTLIGISIVGIIFSGFLTVQELISPVDYTLGLPTCAYGFIVYLAILIISSTLLRSK